MDEPFDSEPTDTRERMMLGTLRVLERHGYAGLSIKRIADEADLSKSSVYHFFDDKDDLLLSFLDYMLEYFQLPLKGDFGSDPLEELWLHLDFALYGATGDFPMPPDGFDLDSGTPYVELRSQAAHDEDYRARFTNIDTTLRDRLITIIETGTKQGIFREVDATQTAELVLTVMMGALFRRATADAIDIDAIKDELETVLEATLLADSAS